MLGMDMSGGLPRAFRDAGLARGCRKAVVCFRDSRLNISGTAKATTSLWRAHVTSLARAV